MDKALCYTGMFATQASWQLQQKAVFTQYMLFLAGKYFIFLYNNQISEHALIGQSAVGYCASKPTEKLRVFWIII